MLCLKNGSFLHLFACFYMPFLPIRPTLSFFRYLKKTFPFWLLLKEIDNKFSFLGLLLSHYFSLFKRFLLLLGLLLRNCSFFAQRQPKREKLRPFLVAFVSLFGCLSSLFGCLCFPFWLPFVPFWLPLSL